MIEGYEYSPGPSPGPTDAARSRRCPPTPRPRGAYAPRNRIADQDDPSVGEANRIQSAVGVREGSPLHRRPRAAVIVGGRRAHTPDPPRRTHQHLDAARCVFPQGGLDHPGELAWEHQLPSRLVPDGAHHGFRTRRVCPGPRRHDGPVLGPPAPAICTRLHPAGPRPPGFVGRPAQNVAVTQGDRLVLGQARSTPLAASRARTRRGRRRTTAGTCPSRWGPTPDLVEEPQRVGTSRNSNGL